ncbi:hypothetical protein PQZ54_05535 [Luminiphilus sp.]|nr:hypothetical protein [Luminiphilus sp.]
MESLDYRYHRVSLNQAQAEVSHTGSVTIVLSGVNPGCTNWISTAGHSEGTLCFRWVGAEFDRFMGGSVKNWKRRVIEFHIPL